MNGKIGTITDDEFIQKVLESGEPTVVDFSAQWCVPCKHLDVVLQEMAHEYKGKISFYKVDVNESNATASRYAVRNIPMLLFFDGGEIVDQAVGALSREMLEEKLNRLLEST